MNINSVKIKSVSATLTFKEYFSEMCVQMVADKEFETTKEMIQYVKECVAEDISNYSESELMKFITVNIEIEEGEN